MFEAGKIIAPTFQDYLFALNNTICAQNFSRMSKVGKCSINFRRLSLSLGPRVRETSTLNLSPRTTPWSGVDPQLTESSDNNHDEF